jgi:geranylgeranylglycerol-phosphate geranylgeranyltransferase
VAALLSGISTNFIYTFNSASDWREDRLSHPRRPVPSGALTPRQARSYALVLLAASIVYPFFVAPSNLTLVLFLLLPALGLVYSAEPIRLRRFPVTAILIISIGLLTPMLIGTLMHGGGANLGQFFAALLLFCLSVVPLKAVDEQEEDAASGRANLWTRHGRGLLVWSLCGLLAGIVVAATLCSGATRLFLVAAFASTAACIALFDRRRTPAGLYQVVILVVIAEGLGFFLVLRLH